MQINDGFLFHGLPYIIKEINGDDVVCKCRTKDVNGLQRTIVLPKFAVAKRLSIAPASRFPQINWNF